MRNVPAIMQVSIKKSTGAGGSNMREGIIYASENDPGEDHDY